jgi:ABC-type glycerol-3-phosphate transport system permease component
MSGDVTAKTVLRYAALLVLASIVLFPLYATIVNSLSTPVEVSRGFPWYPRSPDWANYTNAWTDGHFDRYLVNTVIVTAAITGGQIATAVLAAYAFAFLQFPLKRTLFVLFLVTLMIPGEVTILQNVATISDWGWKNTYWGLVVPFLASGFGAFLLRQSFLQVPSDLREAAFLDGYGHFRFLIRIVVPLTRPAIAAMGLFAFLGAWNQYLWPLLVTDDDRRRTIQVGLKQLASGSVDQITITYAGTVLTFLPIALLLLVFSKQLVRGLAAGAVKG